MVRWPWTDKDGNGEAALPQPVVHFTDEARARLLEVFESRGGSQRAALRVSAAESAHGSPSYGMALEESGQPQADDVAIDVDGIRVLVDVQSLALVDGVTVAFVDDPLRPGFRVDPPQPAAPMPQPARAAAPRPELDFSNPLVAVVHDVLERQVNPNIASHGGRATLIDVREDVVYLELGGGCQGCAMVSVTLKQGVERLIKQAIPQVREVVDVTDHSGGTNPYYTESKGASSPFHQATKA